MHSQTGYIKHAAYRTVVRAIKILKLILVQEIKQLWLCAMANVLSSYLLSFCKRPYLYIYINRIHVQDLNAGYFPVIILSHQLFLHVLYSMSVSLLMLAITRFVKSTYEILYCTCKQDIQCTIYLELITMNGPFELYWILYVLNSKLNIKLQIEI